MLSWNEDVSVFKEALENVNTLKSTSRILTGILSKYSENSELKPNLNSQPLRVLVLDCTIQEKHLENPLLQT